jgi:hypothetical protein
MGCGSNITPISMREKAVAAMTFPSDIKGCMKDCILSVLWPKKEIINLFSGHGCTSADMKSVETYESECLSRAAIIDRVFGSLDRRQDGGLGQYRSLMKSLLDWSRFDPYWFETTGKLNRAGADKNLQHLRQLQEIRDADHKNKRARILAEQLKSKTSTVSLDDVKQRYLSLFSDKITSQKRGYALEKVLYDLCMLSSLETTEAFRTNGEQIDGAVKYDGEHYLIEAKWHDTASSNESLYQFAGKVEGKMYGRGIFISINTFSDNVVKSLVMGKAVKTILVDGEDLTFIVEGLLTFAETLDRKVKAAQTRGAIYINAITGDMKA